MQFFKKHSGNLWNIIVAKSNPLSKECKLAKTTGWKMMSTKAWKNEWLFKIYKWYGCLYQYVWSTTQHRTPHTTKNWWATDIVCITKIKWTGYGRRWYCGNNLMFYIKTLQGNQNELLLFSCRSFPETVCFSLDFVCLFDASE